MKIFRLIVLFFVFTAILSPLFAQKMKLDMRVTEIELMESSTRSIYDAQSREWRSGLPVFMIDVEVKKDIPENGFKMIAYFYDETDKIIHKMNSITSGYRKKEKGNWDSLFKTPRGVKKGEKYELHFLIPDSVPFKTIKRALFVYGADKDYAWKAKPATNLDSIEFNEKALILEAGNESEN